MSLLLFHIGNVCSIARGALSSYL